MKKEKKKNEEKQGYNGEMNEDDDNDGWNIDYLLNDTVDKLHHVPCGDSEDNEINNHRTNNKTFFTFGDNNLVEGFDENIPIENDVDEKMITINTTREKKMIAINTTHEINKLKPKQNNVNLEQEKNRIRNTQINRDFDDDCKCLKLFDRNVMSEDALEKDRERKLLLKTWAQMFDWCNRFSDTREQELRKGKTDEEMLNEYGEKNYTSSFNEMHIDDENEAVKRSFGLAQEVLDKKLTCFDFLYLHFKYKQLENDRSIEKALSDFLKLKPRLNALLEEQKSLHWWQFIRKAEITDEINEISSIAVKCFNFFKMAYTVKDCKPKIQIKYKNKELKEANKSLLTLEQCEEYYTVEKIHDNAHKRIGIFVSIADDFKQSLYSYYEKHSSASTEIDLSRKTIININNYTKNEDELGSGYKGIINRSISERNLEKEDRNCFCSWW